MVGIVFFYAFTLIGIVLVTWSVRQQLLIRRPIGDLLRLVGLAAALASGLYPAYAWVSGTFIVAWPYPAVATTYLIGLGLILSGLSGIFGRETSIGVTRIGYGVLLAVNALPSFVLLPLSPLVATAGLVLVQSDQRTGKAPEARK